jgi:hypothetical protein
MVFSVQQGEHGPLVVYKLAVPQSADPSTAPAVPDPAPTIPATVIIGEPDSAAQNVHSLSPLQTPAANSPGVPDSATVYRIAEEMQDSGRMINAETGGTLTLKQVNDAVAWRRETAEKLRQVPIAPRF